jgi:Uma2 family endonuclease
VERENQLIAHYPLLFEPGDRLSREEFLARWECMPALKKAELIDGVVYVPSPVSIVHSGYDGFSHLLLSFYAARTPGCEFHPNATWLMKESAPQPDSCLCWLPASGEIETINSLATGSPHLILEIAVSTRSYDLGPKLVLYQRAEVPEYVASLVEEKRIEWRIFENGGYRLMAPDADGVFRSKVFPGLWLDSAAFWRKDAVRQLAVLEQGLQSR